MTPDQPDTQPDVLVVIPARGGSKGVPGKNLAPVGGEPLVARAVRASVQARRTTRVVVSTDDVGIMTAAGAAGAQVVRRPADIAGDTSSSESAVLHVLDELARAEVPDPEVVVLVQCTSPFLTPEEIDGVVAAVLDDGADSALTAAPFHGFLWRTDSVGAPSSHGVNHDHAHRPRRQDRPEDLLETGAAYAMRTDGFRAAGHRFFGSVALVRTDPARVLEIDEPDDLARARALAPLLLTDPAAADPTVQEQDLTAPVRLPGREDIDAVVLDFDGTQTDDRVWIDADGRETVAVHRGDGLGVARLVRAGLTVLILSTEANPVVSTRARKLNVPVLQGIARKDQALALWAETHSIDLRRVLYLGNDVNDLSCFSLVGWPTAVADAQPEVLDRARSVTERRGGHGAVREIASWLLGKELLHP
ncbi:YrbI family 3-deoxy-D-manno-octulosonate 8-phosphate phosphatase [Streptomyces sp. 846.5]|nr:acylneuraminate cytidylyltransferase [Streptomyces sp. 846.5]TDU02911.1 YrbI family 3-deoxy-D-manno-octulosonate 8-phosphate phosphatase [Streptomyces sp. 846.5]